MAGKPVMIRMSAEDVALFDAAAKHAGVSRSAFILDAARAIARGVLDPGRPLPTGFLYPDAAPALVRAATEGALRSPYADEDPSPPPPVARAQVGPFTAEPRKKLAQARRTAPGRHAMTCSCAMCKGGK